MGKKTPAPEKIPFGKKAISIRLDTSVLDFFRKTGPKWQSRINDILRAYMERPKKP